MSGPIKNSHWTERLAPSVRVVEVGDESDRVYGVDAIGRWIARRTASTTGDHPCRHYVHG
jgi:hypothetical protein